MTEHNELRWVQYPCLIAQKRVFRYGLFDVHFINDEPAHAELPQIVGLKKEKNGFLKRSMAIQSACHEPILICTNAVNLDNDDWDGSLIFDHEPVLS